MIASMFRAGVQRFFVAAPAVGAATMPTIRAMSPVTSQKFQVRFTIAPS